MDPRVHRSAQGPNVVFGRLLVLEHAAQRADRAAWAAYARFGTNIADRDDDEDGKA